MSKEEVEAHGRTPRWVRGLKLLDTVPSFYSLLSHPTMGAWIEIVLVGISVVLIGSHPTMGAWIEIPVCIALLTLASTSHPTMGAWIEIKYLQAIIISQPVAPHDGCVD